MIYLCEGIEDVYSYYKNIPRAEFDAIIEADPTFNANVDRVGTYGKWLLNLYKANKLSIDQLDYARIALTMFDKYRRVLQNKDIGKYKSLQELADAMSEFDEEKFVDMMTPAQRNKYLGKVRSGKIVVKEEDDYDIILDTPKYVVYVPNTHAASMKLGKTTDWCTAHKNKEHWDGYTENGGKLYIVKDKNTGRMWQYSDKYGDFLDDTDSEFDVGELLDSDLQLKQLFIKLFGVGDGVFKFKDLVPQDHIRPFIKTVIISDGVKRIPSRAFSDCTNLETVKLCDSVTQIGEDAFRNTPWLANNTINGMCIVNNILIKCDSEQIGENVEIPDGVTRIADSAFAYSSIKSVKIPDSVFSIGYQAFYLCKELTSVDIPEGVTIIRGRAFSKCRNLVNVSLPNTLTVLDDHVFSETAISEIVIPDSVVHIIHDAFYWCKALKKVVLGSEVTEIGMYAFYGCESLRTIKFNKALFKIDGLAFAESGLKRLSWFRRDIPNLKVIATNAFDNCKGLVIETDLLTVKHFCDSRGITCKFTENENLKLRIADYDLSE